MAVPVELQEQQSDEARRAEQDSAFRTLVDLFIRRRLLQTLSAVWRRNSKHPSDLAEFFRVIRDALPDGDKQELLSIAAGLQRFFADRYPNDKELMKALGGLILFLCVGTCLRQRLGAEQVKSHVRINVTGKQVPPIGNDLDYGCILPTRVTAEFYECKVRPSDLFREPSYRHGKQLQLMLNARQRLTVGGWEVTCCVPGLMSTSSLQYLFLRAGLGNSIIPYGVEHIPTLAHASPMPPASGWTAAPSNGRN